MATGNRCYALNEDVRIFFDGEDDIRLRKGIWNYVEAVLNLRGQPSHMRSFFQEVFHRLTAEEKVDLEVVSAHANLSPDELNAFQAVFNDIAQQGFVHHSEEAQIRRMLSGLLGGSRTGFEQWASRAAPILLVTDCSLARETATVTAKQMGLPLHLLEFDVIEELAEADLTSKMDAVDYQKTMEKYQKYFANFTCVAGVFISPPVSLLRNINRIMVKQEKAFLIGLVDGPFINVFATVAIESGCFECFEHRLLARIEDTAVYHRFVSANGAKIRHGETTGVLAPVTNILTSAVLMEGALMASLGVSRLAGRVLSIYMPMFEIQIQDLLRVPYCPACGHVSQNNMNELYLNAKQVMDRMLERIELQAEQR